jgi:glycosyltransferase involved in cell wall biosynthesis
MINVSVCLATYNGEKYIKEQLESILCQLSYNDEVVISDDSSSDKTIEIIKDFNDKRIVLFENNIFRNHIKNFEFALSKARGNYIFLSDQDDIWLPNKVSILTAELKHFNLVISDCIYVNSHLDVINDSYFKKSNARKGLIKNFTKNTYLGCCMAFDRKVLNNSMPFPPNIKSHDTWIGLIGEIFGTTKFVTNKLILFRRHGANFSGIQGNDSMQTNISPYSFSEIIISRIYLFKELLKRQFLNYERNK